MTTAASRQHTLQTRLHRCLWRTCRICLVILLTGCSPVTPRLKTPFFPESYRVGSVEPEGITRISPSILVIPLNHQPDTNQDLLNFWKRGYFQDSFQRVQPLSTVFRADIANLADFLNELLTIYLVSFDTSGIVTSSQLQEAFRNRFQCDPMTNLELRFLMNGQLSSPFARKPLTMLLISAHELTLQAGAQPVYPRIFSPYLRKQDNLPPLKDLETINLIATKKENRVYSSTISGFVVCSKRSNNSRHKSTGPP